MPEENPVLFAESLYMNPKPARMRMVVAHNLPPTTKGLRFCRLHRVIVPLCWMTVSEFPFLFVVVQPARVLCSFFYRFGHVIL